MASHDLQEPLRKIQSFGEMLRGQRSEPLGDGVDYLQRMQTAASRMSTLIQDLLAYSRIIGPGRSNHTRIAVDCTQPELSGFRLNDCRNGCPDNPRFLANGVG